MLEKKRWVLELPPKAQVLYPSEAGAARVTEEGVASAGAAAPVNPAATAAMRAHNRCAPRVSNSTINSSILQELRPQAALPPHRADRDLMCVESVGGTGRLDW